MLNFTFLKKQTMHKSKVAIPKRRNASESGEISFTVYLAAIGVKAAAKVRKARRKNFFKQNI